jgi:hypothetical protein
MTIKEAMDLAAQCGAREGSDEHDTATKAFREAGESRSAPRFRTSEGRLNWRRRCYVDRKN